MRRLFAFLLGVVFGIILVFGAVAGAAYYAYAKLTPEQISPETNKFLGDFSKLSVQQMVAKFQDIYATKVNQGDDLYTIGEFMTDNNIDAKTAFGMELPQEVLDIPLFEMTSGEAGMEKAMKAIKVSTIPAIVNMFGETDENGNLTGMFGEEVMAVLAEHNMAELTAEGGLATVLEEIKLVWLLPDAFPSEDADNKLMYAVGQADLGKLLGSVSGNDNLFAQLGEEGGLAALGQLSIMDIAGTSGGGSEMLQLLLGDAKVVDLIDENGNLNPDKVINGLQIGALLGLKRIAVDSDSGYTTIFEGIKKDGDNYIMLDKDVWYQAGLICTKEISSEHPAHTADCYGYNWYEPCNCAEDHHVVIDGVNHRLAYGIYKVLSQLSIEDLTSGDQDTLMSKITGLTIRELMAGQTISGIMETFADMTIAELMDGGIDGILIGDLLGMKRYDVTEVVEPMISVLTPEQLQMLLAMDEDQLSETYVAVNGLDIAMSADGETWYWAQLLCSDEDCTHTHANGHPNLACYGYKWYNECLSTIHDSCEHQNEAHPTETDYFLVKGLMGMLSDYSISRLNSMQSIIDKIKLGDVMEVEGTMLESFANTPIGQLSGKIETLRLGYALSYSREEVTDLTGYVAVSGIASVMKNGANYARKLDGEEEWYKASIVCTSSHEHDANCYSIWTKEDSTYATGIEGKLANETVSDMGELSDLINDLTLGDVMGDNIPPMLASLADTKIGDLESGIDGLYLATFLEYTRQEVADTLAYSPVAGVDNVMTNGVDYIRLETSDNVWYKAAFACHKDEPHTTDCYNFVWYNAGVEVTGITAKLGGKKVSELKNLEDIINNDITLKDVMGDSIPDMLVSIQDKPIGQLGDAINELYVGDAMSYHRTEVVDTTGYGLATMLKKGEEVKYYLRDNGADIILSDDNTNWYEGVLHCEEAHEHKYSCYGYLWLDSSDLEPTGLVAKLANEKISNLNNIQDTINTFKLGDVIEIDGTSAQALKALKDVEIGELGNEFNNLTVADVIDVNAPGTNNIFKELSDVQINNLGSEINNVHIGSALGYELRCDVDHTHVKECWFILDCTTIHEHVDSCWVNADGVTGAIVDMTIEQLSQPDALKDRIDGLELGEILEIDGSNKILEELADTKIENLSSDLNNIRLGVALGYIKNPVDASLFTVPVMTEGDVTVKATTADPATAKYAMTDDKNSPEMYEAIFECHDAEHTDSSEHTMDCYSYIWYEGTVADENKVKGLNGKIASLTINHLDSDHLSNILTSLTIGELMESGMMSLGETTDEIIENSAKFDIIFHDTTAHDEKIDVSTTPLLPMEVQCDLTGYFTYLSQKSSGTAVEFYSLFTHSEPPHWQEMKLSDFIETLLGAL